MRIKRSTLNWELNELVSIKHLRHCLAIGIINRVQMHFCFFPLLSTNYQLSFLCSCFLPIYGFGLFMASMVLWHLHIVPLCVSLASTTIFELVSYLLKLSKLPKIKILIGPEKSLQSLCDNYCSQLRQEHHSGLLPSVWFREGTSQGDLWGKLALWAMVCAVHICTQYSGLKLGAVSECFGAWSSTPLANSNNYL